MWGSLIAEAAREVATAQSRVADKERSAYDSSQVALHWEPQTSDHWKEAVHLTRQKADAERCADVSQAARQEAEQNLQMAQLELARLKVLTLACFVMTRTPDVQYCQQDQCGHAAMVRTLVTVCYPSCKQHRTTWLRLLNSISESRHGICGQLPCVCRWQRQ